jgi:alkylation response protein AidB-like acyl-CoA dehydrogenase
MNGFSTHGFTDAQLLMRDSVQELLRRHLSPERIRALDEAGEFPHAAYDALANAGWMGLPYPEADGGMGGSAKDLAVFLEAVSEIHASMASGYLTTVIYAGKHIQLSGSAELRRRCLPAIVAGKIKMAFALTEPHTGSDAASIATRAVRTNDGWRVSGQKLYITCAHVADYLVTAVRTGPEAGRRGISLMLIDAKAKGVTIRPVDTLGRRTTKPNEIFFDDVHVPADHLLGEENKGWRGLMRGLNIERLCIAACAAGNMRHAIDYARDYARERKAFGKPITEYQAIAHKFADMQMMAETARLHVYRVAEMIDAGLDPVLETSAAKVIATENDFKVCDLGLQIMGGAGYTKAHDMERLFRDSRIGPIGGGTNEIQRNVIAKLMGL